MAATNTRGHSPKHKVKKPTSGGSGGSEERSSVQDYAIENSHKEEGMDKRPATRGCKQGKRDVSDEDQTVEYTESDITTASQASNTAHGGMSELQSAMTNLLQIMAAERTERREMEQRQLKREKHQDRRWKDEKDIDPSIR